MNKTLTVNISGYVFTIEEEAYQLLNNYLQNIRRYFTDTGGQNEIMADIEARIAEMLREKSGGTDKIVTPADINAIMEQMGRPEDFAGEETQKGNSSAENTTTYIRKRVYRDGDDKIIGGVCGGIGHYLGMDPLWLRLAFGASFLFFGSGLLLYILLWIAIPEARSASEKLEMRGEKVDINAIGKQVSEEFERIKTNLQSEAAELNKNLRPRAGNFIRRIGDFITDVAGNLFKAIGKIIAVFFVFVGMLLLIGLLSSLFGTSHIINFIIDEETVTYSIKDLMNIFFSNNNQVTLAAIGLFLVAGIPLLMVVYKGIRMLLKIKERNTLFSTVSTVLFLLGTGILVYLTFLLSGDFAKRGKVTDSKSFLPPGKSLVLRAISDKNQVNVAEEDDETELVFDRNTFVRIDKNTITMGNIEFDILPAVGDSFKLEVIRSARAKTSKEAFIRARNLNYAYELKDSTLLLTRYFTYDRLNSFRGQKIKLHLYVPVGKSVFINNSMDALLYDVKNTSNTLDSRMTGKTWTMLADGLTCVNCPEEKSESNSKSENEKDSRDDSY